MNHAHRFHFDAPPTIENVFFDDNARGKSLFRLTFGKSATSKPVKPVTADSLQRSRDRMHKLNGRAAAEDQITAIALPQPDTRAASARARLQMAIQRTAEDRKDASPAVVLFGAKPNQPICVNKRARLANASLRGHNNSVERTLRKALSHKDAPQQSLFDRLLHLNASEPALMLVH
jgi:hypothetical protein